MTVEAERVRVFPDDIPGAGALIDPIRTLDRTHT